MTKCDARRYSRRGNWVAVLALLGVNAVPLAAQDPYVKISEPAEWRDGKQFVVPAGRAIRVIGIAFHPSRIREVLINGVAAVIEADPPLIRFEHVMTADSQPRSVSIVIVPESSQRFEVRYSMSPPAAPAPVAAPPQPQPQPPPQPQPQPPTRTQPQPPPRQEPPPAESRVSGNPWGGFKLRGVLYGLAAAGGAVMGMATTSSDAEVCRATGGLQDCFTRTTKEPSFPAGMAIAGGVVAIAAIDYLMTSKRAGSASRSSAAADRRAQLTLDVAASPADGRVTLNFLRVRF
jgi:hypothetical protein